MAVVVKTGGRTAKPKQPRQSAVVDLESGTQAQGDGVDLTEDIGTVKVIAVSPTLSHILHPRFEIIYFQFCLLMVFALYIYILLMFSCPLAYCFVESLRAVAPLHPRRCWDHHFHEDFDLASSRTNLIHCKHDNFDNDCRHVDKESLH